MPYSSEMKWPDVVRRLEQHSKQILVTLAQAEEEYKDLQEVKGTLSDQELADQLFTDGGTATSEQVTKTQDAINTALAMHQLTLALDNTAVAADDRRAKLHKFS